MAGEHKKQQPKLRIPYAPSGESKGHYDANTLEEKIVRDYTGYDFERMDRLTVFEFWAILHDAVIFNCQRTESGRKYLDECWLHEQTEPDRDALLKHFGRK